MKNQLLRVLCVLLALVMFTVFAVSSSSPADDNSGEASATTSKTDTASKSEQETSKADDASKSEQETSKTEESKESKKEVTYTINNEVIVDNDKCSFTIKEAKSSSIWGLEFKVVCENKTSDLNLMFAISDVSVNGYMVNALFSEEVAAGKKSNDEISFLSSLKDNGISSVDEFTFTLRIYDSDDWTADKIVEQEFTVYPTGKAKSDIEIPARKTYSSEKVILDNEYCTFILLQTDEDSLWGYSIDCFIENKTDKKIMVSWNDVSVNGYMVSPIVIIPTARK